MLKFKKVVMEIHKLSLVSWYLQPNRNLFFFDNLAIQVIKTPLLSENIRSAQCGSTVHPMLMSSFIGLLTSFITCFCRKSPGYAYT